MDQRGGAMDEREASLDEREVRARQAGEAMAQQAPNCALSSREAIELSRATHDEGHEQLVRAVEGLGRREQGQDRLDARAASEQAAVDREITATELEHSDDTTPR